MRPSWQAYDSLLQILPPLTFVLSQIPTISKGISTLVILSARAMTLVKSATNYGIREREVGQLKRLRTERAKVFA